MLCLLRPAFTGANWIIRIYKVKNEMWKSRIRLEGQFIVRFDLPSEKKVSGVIQTGLLLTTSTKLNWSLFAVFDLLLQCTLIDFD